MNEKYKLFLENARLIYGQFRVKPLLYGSLGLEALLHRDLQADDIDILIPGALLREKWDRFRTFLDGHGYVLTDLHEHTFRRDGVSYSYAPREELAVFAGVSSFVEKDVFLCLTLEDYLRVYEASALDGYRQRKKNKRDTEKINIIKAALQPESRKSDLIAFPKPAPVFSEE